MRSKQNKFKIQIELFDREALEYAAKLEGVSSLLDELGYVNAAAVCKELRDLIASTLCEQTSVQRADVITKKSQKK